MQIPGPDPTSNESKFMGMGPKINLYFKKQASERTLKSGKMKHCACVWDGRKEAVLLWLHPCGIFSPGQKLLMT